MRPATAPAAVPASVASQGLVPVEIRTAQTAPQWKAAVDREIGKAQQAKRDEDAQRHQAEDQANFNGTEYGK